MPSYQHLLPTYLHTNIYYLLTFIPTSTTYLPSYQHLLPTYLHINIYYLLPRLITY